MSAPFRVVALASGRGSNLRALLKAKAEGRCAVDVAALVTDRPNAPVLKLAEEWNIPTEVVPLRRGDDRMLWNERLGDAIAHHRPDLVVCAGFMRILGPELVTRFSRRIVNVHPALLPSFPGVDGPAQAIEAAVHISGCTVHLVDEGVDTGPILSQGAVPVLPADTAATLHTRIQGIEHALLPMVVNAIAVGVLDLDAQPPRWRNGDASAMALVNPQLSQS